MYKSKYINLLLYFARAQQPRHDRRGLKHPKYYAPEAFSEPPKEALFLRRGLVLTVLREPALYFLGA
jgi:hypothetical protein